MAAKNQLPGIWNKMDMEQYEYGIWNMEQNGYGTKLHYCHPMYNEFVEILVFVSCVQGLVGLNVDR